MIFHVNIGSDTLSFDLPRAPLIGDQIQTQDGSLVVIISRRWVPPDRLGGDYYLQYYGDWVTVRTRSASRFPPDRPAA